MVLSPDSCPPEEQERVGRTLQQLGMTMGVFVVSADFGNVAFAFNDGTVCGRLLGDLRCAVEVARRAGVKWCTVVPGRYDQQRAWDYQTATGRAGPACWAWNTAI